MQYRIRSLISDYFDLSRQRNERIFLKFLSSSIQTVEFLTLKRVRNRLPTFHDVFSP